MTDARGRVWELPMLTAWRLEYTSGVPCDSFWLRCPWEAGNPTSPRDWVGFTARYQGETVFTGVVDECVVTQDGKGCALAFNGWQGGTEFRLVSADFVDFTPVRLL